MAEPSNDKSVNVNSVPERQNGYQIAEVCGQGSLA